MVASRRRRVNAEARAVGGNWPVGRPYGRLDAMRCSVLLFLALALGPLDALAAPPGVRTELAAVRQAVASGDARAIGRRMAPGGTLFRTEGGPDRTGRRLDAAAVQAALAAGQANALGLDRLLLLPRARDMARVAGGRWSATDRRCPEVRWIFARRGGRWVLDEVVRVLLAC